MDLAVFPVELDPLSSVGTDVDDGHPGDDGSVRGSLRPVQVDDATPEGLIFANEILKSAKYRRH